MKFEYIGSKAGGVPVTFPLGVKSKMGIRKTVYASPFIEIDEKDAALFLKLYNNGSPCFRAVTEAPALEEYAHQIEEADQVHEHSEHAPKKRGPKPKHHKSE